MRSKIEDGPGPESQECLNRTYRNIGKWELGIFIFDILRNYYEPMGSKIEDGPGPKGRECLNRTYRNYGRMGTWEL